MNNGENKIFMPSNEIIIPGQERLPEDPVQEMDRMIRNIQQAKGKDLKTLVSVLHGAHQNGWPLCIDDTIPTGYVVLTLTSHLWRDTKEGA